MSPFEQVSALRWHVQTRREEVGRLQAELVRLRTLREELFAQVQHPGGRTRLSPWPLAAAISGSLLAPFGLFWAYISLLDVLRCGNNSCESQLYIALALGSLLLALGSAWASRRPGAGGSARRTLRLAIFFFCLALAAGLALIAVLLAAGRCPRVFLEGCF